MRTIATLLAALVLPLTATAEPVAIKFSWPSSPRSTYVKQVVAPWVADVNKAAGGALAVKLFPGNTIANYGNVYDRILNGVIEIGYGVYGPITDQFPRTQVVTIPFVSESCVQATVALWHLYEKGVIAAEYGRVHPLAMFAFPASGLHSKVRIKTLDDYKGLKVIVPTRNLGEIVERLGGVPVPLTPGEIYQALNRGVAQGTHIGWAAILAFRLQEVAPFHLDVPLGHSPGFVFMNKDAYARLPQKGKAAIDKFSYMALSKGMGASGDYQIDHNRSVVSKMPGQTVYTLNAKETAEWKQRIKPVTDAVIRAMPDGEKVRAAYLAELKTAPIR